MGDNRVGTYNEDGSVAEWPEKDILGNDYNKPPTTHGLDAKHFCVLPSFGQYEGPLKALKAQFQPSKPDAKKSGGTPDVESKP